MSMTQQQSLNFNSKGQGESIQTRLALLSHLTEKQEGSSIYKKKTFFWDQEHLYSENLMLKAQVKQLTQANTKSRTTILEMQAEMKQKQSKNNEHDLKQSALRSMSLRNLGKKSMIVFRPSLQEEKSKSIRQIIRELKEEIAALKNEKEILKRSLKYTRMSQLQALNKEMDLELQRLNRLVNENKNKYYALALEMEALNEVLKKERLAKQLIGQERDKIRKELTRAKNGNSEFQKRIQLSQKQSRNEIRKLRSINPEITVLNTESAAKTLGKLNSQSFKSIPKLEYSISGLQRIQNDTINFDKLLNSESQLKSIPKITSFTSLELQKMSFKNDGNSPEHKAKTSEKVESCSEMENLEEEAYEFEEDEVEVAEVKKTEQPKAEEIYEQDETEIIKQVEEVKVKEESKENAKKPDKQKNEPITDDFFEDQTPKVKQQAQKPKVQPKQEEWEEEFEELQEYDDPVKEVVKPVKNEKPEELFQDFEVESFEPVQEPKKQEPVKKENPIFKSTKQQPQESFEEDDAEIIKEIQQPLPKEKFVESKTESKQHQPVALTTKPQRQEVVKEQNVQSKQPSPSTAPSQYELPKSLLAIEAEKQQPVSIRPMQVLEIEEKKEEIVKQQVKPEVMPEIIPEVKAEAKPELKPEVKQEVKTEVKTEVKNEAKVEVKTEVKPEVKTEVKNETKVEAKTEGKAEAKNAVKVEVKNQMMKEVKEEVLEEVEDEVKEESVQEDLMVQEEI